jgi:hypothetical protein
MPLTDTARKNHDALFPGHVSTLAVSDPELIEIFDNFAFYEILEHGALDLRMRLITQLAAIIESRPWMNNDSCSGRRSTMAWRQSRPRSSFTRRFLCRHRQGLRLHPRDQ